MQNDDPAETKDAPETLAGAGTLLAALGRRLRRDAWLYGLILLGLIAAEAGLRWSQPRLAGLTYGADVTGGHPIALTEAGYRIPPGVPPAAGPPLLLGLGDSTTFGTGVAAAQTWPLRIGAHNAAAEGSEPREFVFGLREVWAPPAPDAVLLLITPNMISFTDFRWDNAPRDPRRRLQRLGESQAGLRRTVEDIVQSSALWKAVTLNISFFKFQIGLNDHLVKPVRPLSPLMPYGWVQPDVAPETYTRMWDRFETALQDLARQTRAQGSCLILGYLPPRFTLSDHPLDNLKAIPKDRLTEDAGARVRALAATLDLPFSETEKALRQTRAATGPWRAPLYIPGDYTHLDAQGHEIMARSFEQVLTPILDGRAACTHSR
jgi:lysophospholipase L1-like esterase